MPEQAVMECLKKLRLAAINLDMRNDTERFQRALDNLIKEVYPPSDSDPVLKIFYD